MKRIFILAMVLLGMASEAMADNVVVSDVAVPQGGQATFEIGFNFDSGKTYAGCQFDLVLPEGVSVQKDATGIPIVVAGSGLSNHSITPSTVSSGDSRFVVVSFTKAPIVGTSGTVLSVTLNADAALEVGRSFEALVTNITFTTVDVEDTPFDDIPFNITIGEPADTRTVLNETSTTTPEAATNVDVRVKRTIKANEWSTICLPFAMTAAQVKAAFGNDVELAHFTGYDATEDGDGNITGITVNFNDVTAIEANHPYIIKVLSAVSEFTVDGVDIEPEDEPCIEYDNGLTGKKRVVYSTFTGTYVANKEVPKYGLFLMDNLFYYSAGDVEMKAFRAYFDFYDILTDVEDELSEAKIRMSFNDASSIEGIGQTNNLDSAVYDLSGRRLSVSSASSVLPKGMYIMDGKKVIIK